MGVSVTIDLPSVDAVPGTAASCQVQVLNTGMVVDRIALDVVGDSREWATVEPQTLNLLPGTSGSAQVTFQPPRAPSMLAGEVPFALRAVSQEDPEGSAVEEGVVQVGAYRDLKAAITPRTSSGKRHGRHRLVIENRGNVATQVRFGAADPDEALIHRFTPDLITAAPGTATFVKVRMSPRKRFLKGPNKSLPFQVFALPEDCEPVTTDATVLQRQTMPTWLLPAIGVLAIGVLALVGLWFLALKPQVESTATAVQSKQADALASDVAKASQAASAASEAAGANSAAIAAAGGAKPTAGARPTASIPPTPVSLLLQSDVAPSDTGSYPYPIPAPNTTLAVSDLFLQNPNADIGTLEIASGTTPLFRYSLQNFRNLDYHYVQALTFTSKSPLTLVVTCRNPGTTKCTAGLTFFGQLHK